MSAACPFLSPVRPRLRLSITCVGIPLLILLSGCSGLKVKLGWRVSLVKIPVTSLEASLPKNPGIAPGEKAPLVVTLNDQTGKVWVTEGAGKGKVLWKELKVVPTVVSFNNKGTLTLPKDPRVSDGKTGHVSITVPSHPGLKAELDIPLRYDYVFKAKFEGADGIKGFDGTNGIDGMSGSMGSTDPNNPSPGGNGGDGTNGTDGSNGGDGSDAPPVTVRMTLHPGPRPLLEIAVSTQRGKQRFYLVDPQGGSLTIDAQGGSGGAGGKGGRGGRGGAGGIGTPNGNSGHDGMDGHDGMSGSSGRGGSITVIYDPTVKGYLSILHLSNDGGPKPGFQEEPVPPLW